jgi:hypothetical protein
MAEIPAKAHVEGSGTADIEITGYAFLKDQEEPLSDDDLNSVTLNPLFVV